MLTESSHKIPLFAFSWLILLVFSSQSWAAALPWAEDSFKADGTIRRTSFTEVSKHVNMAVFSNPNNNQTPSLDDDADTGKITYTTEKVEKKDFTGELDLSTQQGLFGLAVLVDDDVTVTITEKVSGKSILQAKKIDGDAFWRPKSFQQIINLKSGSIYKIDLKYENTANFSNEKTGARDYDGINLYVYGVLGDLEIYSSGMATNPVIENDEETMGGLCVANLNDTDGDGVIDNIDNIVQQGKKGDNEKDLMRLIIHGPKEGRVKLNVVSGALEFWEKPTKEMKIEKKQNSIFIDHSVLPKTIWIESTQASQKMRDINLILDIENADGKIIKNVDKVVITAVWAEEDVNEFKNQNNDGLWGDAKNPLLDVYNEVYKDFGIQYSNDPNVGVCYGIGMAFKVRPSGIGKDPRVKFDFGRRGDAKSWRWDLLNNNFLLTASLVLDDHQDLSNDDPSDLDEDVIPTKNDLIYTIDGPGFANDGFRIERVLQANFYEFVRVSLDGVRPSGNTADGSRCSDKVMWHTQIWAESNNRRYQPKAGKRNSVGKGHQPVGAKDPAP